MNYSGTGRSNYFSVTNLEAFKAICLQHNLTFIHDNHGKVGFICSNEGGDIPAFDEDDVEVDPLSEIAALLPDNEVLVFITVGAEGHRYLTGYAVAINNKGETRNISLDNIYLIATELGSNPISNASY